MTKYAAKRESLIMTVGCANKLTQIMLLKSDPLAKHVFMFMNEDRQSIDMFVFNSEPNEPTVLDCKNKMINEI